MRCVRWVCGGVVLAAALTQAASGQQAENFFTHGPMLGRVEARSIGVWGRTGRPAEFVVRYGTSPDRLDQSSPPVRTELARDNTGWVLIEGLEPNTRYYYELAIPGVNERTGRSGSFKTLPDGRDYLDPDLNPRGLFNFSFEFACGNNQNPAHSSGPSLPAFRTMNRKIADKIDFAILNGDWLYEVRRDFSPAEWLAQVGRAGEELPYPVKHAPTLVGVWQNYKHFLEQGTPLARWHAHVPSFYTFDDHEILNDVWGAGTPGLRDRRAVFRDIGVQAWYDYVGWSNPTEFPQPIHFGRARLRQGSNVLSDPDADFAALDLAQMNNLHVHWGTPTAGVNDNRLDGVGGDPNAGVYRIVKVLGPDRLEIDPPARADGQAAYSVGRRSYYRFRVSNCDFFVLDTRSQREMHDTRQPDKPGLSMLGPEQRRWLLEGMKESDADFLFVVSSVNFMVPHVGGGAVREDNKDDAWTVFLDERETLIDAWDALPQPVFVLTGDLHNSFAIRITDNVWEFASGPHNSNNHHAGDEGDRPPNGPFQYGPRECDIRWSTWFAADIPRGELRHPMYCVVQINNVLNNPKQVGETRWIAFPRPQVIFQYYDGRTGDLRYAESILAAAKE